MARVGRIDPNGVEAARSRGGNSMQYVNLGRCGLKVSRLALGCMSFGLEARAWRLDEEASRATIRRAVELGINFFDTADMYGMGESEIVLGRVIAELGKRDEVVLATKLFYPTRPGPNGRGLSRKAVFASIDGSLKRLGTDYVDLYQIHRWDPDTPIEETMEALDDIVKMGKVRYIGASSMFAWQLCKAQHIATQSGRTRFVSVQPHYNLLNREEEREMIPMCLSEGIGVLPWSPLARGRLARPWDAPSTSDRVSYDRTAEMLYSATAKADERVVAALGEVAKTRGLSQSQVALAWLLCKPAVVSPIVGAGKIAHLENLVDALSIKLGDDEIEALEACYIPHGASFYQEVVGGDQDR
jgi:aryl-alcohol dehydrogenase-like predicted oxidoreductase